MWLDVMMGTEQKSPVYSHVTEKLLYISSDIIVIYRQVLIEGIVLRFVKEIGPPFLRGHPSHAKV